MNDAETLLLKSGNMIAESNEPIGWMVFNKPLRRNAVDRHD